MSAESYVVRIYRREPASPHAVIGVIEAMPTGWQKPFRTLSELMEILARAPASSPPEARASTGSSANRDDGPSC
jgi:hypothetical protein